MSISFPMKSYYLEVRGDKIKNKKLKYSIISFQIFRYIIFGYSGSNFLFYGSKMVRLLCPIFRFGAKDQREGIVREIFISEDFRNK